MSGLIERAGLDTPQSARATLRAGDRFVMEAEVQVTPLGLLAIAGLVSGILLSVPPIVRAAGQVGRTRRLEQAQKKGQ